MTYRTDKCLYEYIEVLNLKICVINVKMYQDKIRQEMGMSGEKQLAGYELFSDKIRIPIIYGTTF